MLTVKITFPSIVFVGFTSLVFPIATSTLGLILAVSYYSTLSTLQITCSLTAAFLCVYSLAVLFSGLQWSTLNPVVSTILFLVGALVSGLYWVSARIHSSIRIESKGSGYQMTLETAFVILWTISLLASFLVVTGSVYGVMGWSRHENNLALPSLSAPSSDKIVTARDSQKTICVITKENQKDLPRPPVCDSSNEAITAATTTTTTTASRTPQGLNQHSNYSPAAVIKKTLGHIHNFSRQTVQSANIFHQSPLPQDHSALDDLVSDYEWNVQTNSLAITISSDTSAVTPNKTRNISQSSKYTTFTNLLWMPGIYSRENDLINHLTHPSSIAQYDQERTNSHYL